MKERHNEVNSAMGEKWERITSRQNPTIKRIFSLGDKKGRRQEGAFKFDGTKLFCEAISQGLELCYVIIHEDAPEHTISLVCEAIAAGRLQSRAIKCVSEQVYEKLSEERSPQGIISVARLPEGIHRTYTSGGKAGESLLAASGESFACQRGERILLAESVRDPGNLGTIIRSCGALGIDRLILSDDCADLYNPKTVRGAMGALFRQRIDILPHESFADGIRSIRESGRRVFAAALHREARMIGQEWMRDGDCFVIGNEGHGLCEQTIAACDGCAAIPMREGSESLNAAAAAAICIWETVRAK